MLNVIQSTTAAARVYVKCMLMARNKFVSVEVNRSNVRLMEEQQTIGKMAARIEKTRIETETDSSEWSDFLLSRSEHENWLVSFGRFFLLLLPYASFHIHAGVAGVAGAAVAATSCHTDLNL